MPKETNQKLTNYSKFAMQVTTDLRNKGHVISKTDLSAVKWVFNSLKIKNTNESNMKKIDEWLGLVLTGDKDALEKSTTILTENSTKTFIKCVKKVLKNMTNYEFKTTTGSKRHHKNFVEMPPCVEKMCENDPNFKNIFYPAREYINKKSKNEQYVYNCMFTLKMILSEMEDKKIIDRSFNRKDLITCLQNIENKEHLTKKSRNNQAKNGDLRAMTLRSIIVANHLIDSGLFDNLKDVRNIDKSDVTASKKEIKKVERDYFTDEEVEKLADSFKTSRERVIFSFLLTTGMRIGAIRSLKVENVFDKNLVPLTTGSATEKFSKTHKYVIYAPLRQALENYRDDNKALLDSPQNYIFPVRHKKSSKYPCSHEYMNKLIKEVCDRAGLHGDYVHAHAFRKTVVSILMKAGNTIEKVSKFIGNDDIETTAKHYWVVTAEDLGKRMNVPWVKFLSDPMMRANEIGGDMNDMQKMFLEIGEGVKFKQIAKILIDILTPEQTEKFKKTMETKYSESDTNIQISNILSTIGEYAETISELGSE